MLSSLVANTIISASLIPALLRDSLDKPFPVINRQSNDCDSFIDLGSGSINATLLLSSLKAAATPLP